MNTFNSFLASCTVSLTVAIASLPISAQSPSDLPRIAHAGGEISGTTYTNSFEALNANYALGFRAFEIDFSWTSDGAVVCLHDWDESFERSFDLPPTDPLTLTEFQQLVRERSAFEKCTLAGLEEWLEKHPDTLLITDAKERNIETLAHISSNYPRHLARIIPQIYQPDEYRQVRALGYGDPIWTLYEFPGGPKAVLATLGEMELLAVAMNARRATQGLGLELDSLGISSYVHTVNNYADWMFFQSLGIDQLYTDNLTIAREKKLAGNDSITVADSPVRQALEARAQELATLKDRFFQLPKTHYSLAEDFSLASISTNQICMLGFDAGRLDLTSAGNDPYINFPPFADRVTDIRLYIRLDVPDSSTLEIFYATRTHPGFSESFKLSELVVAGANEIVIGISATDPITRFRLDPGTVAGNYRISRLEVRSN